MVVAAVLLAALLHAGWNAVAHAIADRRVGFFLINVAIGVVPLPFLAYVAVPPAAAWPFLAGSVVVHLSYNLLLLRSYQLGDFGQTYPLARGTAPLLVALVSVTVVGDRLDAHALAGILAICVGLATLVLGGGGLRASGPAVRAAMLTGLAIATYTVLDGVGVRHAGVAGRDTAGYIAWLFVLQGPVIALAVAWRRPRIWRAARPLLVPGLLAGVVSMVAYGLVIWAQTRGQLATVAALRECSIVFGALIGAVVFHERLGAPRVVGAVTVLIGVALLATS